MAKRDDKLEKLAGRGGPPHPAPEASKRYKELQGTSKGVHVRSHANAQAPAAHAEDPAPRHWRGQQLNPNLADGPLPAAPLPRLAQQAAAPAGKARRGGGSGEGVCPCCVQGAEGRGGARLEAGPRRL